MRRIVMFNQVTADGFFAAPDGNLDWVVKDDAVDDAAMEGEGGLDTVLFGRKTYEMFASFWPKAVESSGAKSPHGGGELSDTQRGMGVALNEATKVVFSKSLKSATWKNTRLVRDFDPRAIEAMKREKGHDIMIFGSGSIVSQLTQHGLIDEYHFVVSPVLLGSGRRLIDNVSKRSSLKLQKSKAFPSGVLMLQYARVK